MVTFTEELFNGKHHLSHGMIIAGLPKLAKEIFKANVWADKVTLLFIILLNLNETPEAKFKFLEIT